MSSQKVEIRAIMRDIFIFCISLQSWCAARAVLSRPRACPSAPGHLQSASRASQSVPRTPKSASRALPERPRTPQTAPRAPQSASRAPQSDPRAVPEPPKAFLECPRVPPERPESAPECPQNAPERPQSALSERFRSFLECNTDFLVSFFRLEGLCLQGVWQCLVSSVARAPRSVVSLCNRAG